jgi:hypothetical protein
MPATFGLSPTESEAELPGLSARRALVTLGRLGSLVS